MGKYSDQSDADLVSACLTGDESAWDEFYRRFIRTVRAVVRRRLAISVQEAEDVAQNVFASLIPGLRKYDPTQPLKRFVCVVAERACITEYRKASAGRRNAPTDPVDHHGTGEPGLANPVSNLDSPEEKVSRGQLIRILREGLRSLGEKCRSVLRLRYFEGLPYKEIAQSLGGTEAAVRVRARRCLDELRAVYIQRLKEGRSP